MTEVLIANTRTEFGKGAARRLRRDGQIPAVVYGHGTDPIHVSFDGHELTLTLRKSLNGLTIDIDGKKHTVAARDVQRDPVLRVVEHVDLIIVTAAEAEALANAANAAAAAAEEAANIAAAAAAEKAAARAAAKAEANAPAASSAPAEESNED